MPRSSYYRHRSSSGGSFAEMTPVKKRIESNDAAKNLMDILVNLRDSRGRALLHQVSSDEGHLLALAQKLLQRASELDLSMTASSSVDSSMLQTLVLQTDLESGYTPLHWAIMEGNLSTILLLLRQVASTSVDSRPRLYQRPIHLLQGDFQSNSVLMDMVQARDWEGMTPLDLLGSLQRDSLQKCRDSLPSPKVIPPNPTWKKKRSSSFDIQDQDDEFVLLSQGIQEGILLPPDEEQVYSQGAEVLTYGRANHYALGVSDASSANQKNRPQRVQSFALSDRGIQGSAVAISAAAHHTLVATRSGALYAFGLGTGGRLGTGDDRHALLPTRVLGSLSKRKVVSIAAAENHSLCVTSDGNVYSWGSNRFGQLGNTEESSCSRPKRVDDLRGVFCVAVAAGDKHSVALTRNGQVYTWGDNQAGQLGIMRNSGVQRVEALWKAQPCRVAVAIAASERSTLALICPAGVGLPVNTVFSWGHGNYMPSKVNFDTKQSSSSTSRHHHYVNPVAIACAKHHNAAVSEDGRVYTWGWHSESLGTNEKGRSKSVVIASPQLVTGMLPENGGGVAVAVSASENHTTVVTETGHLFTWGASYGKDVLGHEGVRFQPSPKRVSAAHRVIGVAAAKEHTVLLVGTSFPPLPPIIQETSLENLAARRIAQHVDLFNVIPVSIMAERTQCSLLSDYCNEFIKDNLDAVLTLGRKGELDTFLNDKLADSRQPKGRDGNLHPLICEIVDAGSDNQSWMQACHTLLEGLPISTLVKYRQQTQPPSLSRRKRTMSFQAQSSSEDDRRENEGLQTGFQGCSNRCLMLTSNVAELTTRPEILSKYECLSREARGNRKRLAQIGKLEQMQDVSSEERDKITRKPLLEADLAVLKTSLEKIARMMEERNMGAKPAQAVASPDVVTKDKPATVEQPEEDVKVAFHCELCGINCPDAKSLELHKNGRKHRNRVAQVEEGEKKRAANDIVEQKRKQLVLSGKVNAPATQFSKSKAWSRDSVEPRYQLPPPPHRPGPTPSKANTRKSAESPKPLGSFQSIMEEEKKQSGAIHTLVTPTKKKLLSPGHVPPLKSPPWLSTSVARSSTATGGSGKKTYSLGEFLNTTTPQRAPVPTAAPWSAGVTTPTQKTGCAPDAQSGKSLLEIQQEEEHLRQHQSKTTVPEGKWFLQRTERAESFSNIQQEAESERELQLLIEEQKQIEQQIENERQQKKKAGRQKSKASNKKRQGGKNNNKSKKLASDGQQVEEGKTSTASKSNNRRKTRRKPSASEASG